MTHRDVGTMYHAKIWARYALSESEATTKTYTEMMQYLSEDEKQELLSFLAGFLGSTPKGKTAIKKDIRINLGLSPEQKVKPYKTQILTAQINFGRNKCMEPEQKRRKTFIEEMEDLADECAASFEADDW